ncbi:MAG: ComF family protein [Caulobacteraceae bacterium]
MKILMNLLYPPQNRCDICGSPSSYTVCEACMSAIEFLEGVSCLKCGKNLNECYEDSICPDCKSHNSEYERAFSCFEYKGTGKKMIYSLKYEGKVRLAETIALLMYDKLKNEGLKIDAVAPVPIHPNKLKARGFNQAYLIAEGLSARLNKPLLDCLERVKETKEQYNLDRFQRFLNIVDAISVKLLYNIDKYKSILLVDDIYTTGSTVNECSKMLKKAGIEKVYVITAATGSNT